MAVNDLLVGLLACALVASAVAYGEIQRWHGLALFGLYGIAGLMASELAAAPMMWSLLGLRSGVKESLAMAISIAVAVHQIVGMVVDRGAYDATD